MQVFPSSDLLISCRRNDVTPNILADTLLKMTKMTTISSSSLPLPNSPSPLFSLVEGQLTGLIILERRGKAGLIEGWVLIPHYSTQTNKLGFLSAGFSVQRYLVIVPDLLSPPPFTWKALPQPVTYRVKWVHWYKLSGFSSRPACLCIMVIQIYLVS